VASSVGGLKEIVTHGESGILVPPGDSDALAEAVKSLLKNDLLQRRLAAGARRRAESFSMERRSSEFLKLLSESTREAA
jgi:glycosyltransferase involved in cell wall biosynthesis